MRLTSQPSETPTELILRAQQGEAQAVGALYDQHHSALFRFIWARVGDPTLAEDLTGDVFMRMLTALPRYRPSAAPFRVWLYRIARNRLIDHYRQTRARPTAPLSSIETHTAPDADVALLLEQKLLLAEVQGALAQLEAAASEVLALRFLAGLSIEETAATVGKTPAAVKAVQHRGLAALRRTLSPTEASHD